MQRGRRSQGGLLRWIDAPAFVPLGLLAAAIVRLGWIALVDARPIDDFQWYYGRAIGLAAGDGLRFGGRLTALWPVGYPATLALLFLATGPSLVAAKLLNVALGVGTVWLSYGIARALFQSERTARLTLLGMAFYPNHVAYTSLTATELPFLFALLLGVWLLLRRRTPLRLPGAGAAFGWGCLIKPIMLFIPALMLLAAHGRERRLRAARDLVVVYAVMLAVVAPWTLRNWREFGSFILVSNNDGINLLIGNNPEATGGYVRDTELTPVLDAAGSELERDRLARSLAKDYMRTHPWATLARAPAKLWHLWAKDVEGLYWNELATGAGEDVPPSERPFYLAKLAAQAVWLGLLGCFALACARFALAGRPPGFDPRWTFGLWLIAYTSALALVFFGSSRFHFPLVPFVAMYSAAGLVCVDRGRRRVLKPRRVAAEAPLALPVAAADDADPA
jgi:4-amino-4-deoxy-L-arabinose transferase-like glycosyltransferase